MEDREPPISIYTELRDSFERLDALSELGYHEPLPFGWLLLEEGSAQTFIQGALLPIFVPRLAALRLVSAGGVGNVSRSIRALEHMVLFAHLAEKERHRAWVIVDGDEDGLSVVTGLRADFKAWPSERFGALSRPNIEDYYLPRFRERVAQIEATQDRRAASILKGELAKDVTRWAIAIPSEAREELWVSARDVIDRLTRIVAEVDEVAR